MTRKARAGFTLIELMVALAIGVILLLLATPGYVRWLADAEVQSGAASVAAGIRGAQAEAVKRNTMVEFVIVPGAGWKTQLQGTTTAIDQGAFASGSAASTFVVTPSGATKVTFSPLGRIWTDDGTATGKNLDGSARLTQIDVSNAHGTRPLRVMFGGMGAPAKVCDPAFDGQTPPDPKGCT
jgi:type IV fimbrial biogenesis protein FimT